MEVLFGVLHFDPHHRVAPDALRRTADLLGAPTAEIRIDGCFGIGLQRTILDPAAQAAITTSADGDWWAAMTGEIENRAQLTAELRPLLGDGPERDADVLLALYRARGDQAARALHGFFNAVVWNRRTGELVLIADRCTGIRRLYYYCDRRRLVFGSAVRAVIAADDVPRALDEDSLEDLLVFGHTVAPRTLFRDVQVVGAGTSVRCRDAGTACSVYWRREPHSANRADLAELDDAYFDALQSAVARSVAAPGRKGVMLSGGVDSAAIIALLRRLGVEPIKTFSIHVGDPAHPDDAAANDLARRFDTEHHSIGGPEAGSLEAMPTLIWDYETAGVGFQPTYWLAAHMREECDVALGGYGNDLIWGTRRPTWRSGRVLRRLLPPINELQYLRARRCLSRRALRQLCLKAAANDRGVLHRLAPYRIQAASALDAFIAMDETVYGDQLVYRELGKSMVDAHGVWPRLPFNDARVTELVESVPSAAKIRPVAGGLEFKSFFKRSMRAHNLLPEEIVARQKTWMSPPVADWLRGELRPAAEALLLRGRFVERGLFDPATIARLLNEHWAAKADHAWTLMMVLAIEIWHRVFIDPATLARPDAGLADLATIDHL